MPRPTTHADAVAHLREVLRAQGHDPDPVLDRHGLREASPSGRVDRVAYLEAKADLARSLGDPHLGLRLGCLSRTESFGLFGALVSHAPTVLDAIRDGCRALALWEQGTEVRVEATDDGVRVHYRNLHGSAEARRIDNDHSVVWIAGALRALSGEPPSQLRITVSPPAPRDTVLRNELRARGAITHARDAWHVDVPRAVLLRPLLPTHPAARRLIEEQVARGLAELGADEDLHARLHRSLRRHLDRPRPLRATAAELGVSTRTLQSYLEARGTTYSRERDAVRAEVARSLLRDSSRTIAEVSRQVGFASLPGFSRFFTRHTGEAPSAFRAAGGQR